MHRLTRSNAYAQSTGHTAFKARLDTLSLGQDMQRLRIIQEVIGDDNLITVTLNCHYPGTDINESITPINQVQ